MSGTDASAKSRATPAASPRPTTSGRVALPAVADAVVLFCGAGGSSLGLERAGWRTVGLDHWAPAVAVHRAAGMEAHGHDLADPDLDHLIARTSLLWASPPCQPFSAAGSSRGEDDERDGWPWTLRIVARNLPDVVITENVAGMAHKPHRAYFLNVVAGFEALGYRCEWRILNAADYGVPQVRRRLFIIARRDGGPIVWPMPTHAKEPGLLGEQPWVTIAEALRMTDRWQWIDTRTERGTVDATTEPAPTVTQCAGWQWTFQRPATTVSADPRIAQPGHHDRQMRNAMRMEPHELARLQGFPVDYPFDAAGGRTAQFRAIGNAVPPIMAQVLAEANPCNPMDIVHTMP